MDSYLLNYIFGFLKLCSYCQTYQYNNEITCCICKKFHCNRCLDNFKKYMDFMKVSIVMIVIKIYTLFKLFL